MRSKKIKNLTTAMAVLMVVAVLTSCNRGGVGCPYELEAATNILTQFIK